MLSVSCQMAERACPLCLPPPPAASLVGLDPSASQPVQHCCRRPVVEGRARARRARCAEQEAKQEREQVARAQPPSSFS